MLLPATSKDLFLFFFEPQQYHLSMLETLLVSQLYGFLLVFCRLGAALMLMPGFGETYVPMRFRLTLAVMFSLVVTPLVMASLPPIPTTVFGIINLIIAEILVGLFMGGISRFLIAAVHIAGTIIAYQSSLISAVVPDISQTQGQGTSLGNLLGVTALVLLFATDLHHVLLKGMSDSYTLFAPGHFPLVEDFANHASKTMNGAFRTAMQLAAPHIVIGLLLYLAAGIISRLMPNIQIFFIMMPPQILLSFFILMVAASAMMMWYLDYFRETTSGFLAP
jgi:flagellar biosynthesis protein FliR